MDSSSAAAVHVIIPALDEEGSLPEVLERLGDIPHTNTIVVDNGSRDRTAEVARLGGATVVAEPHRGYGAACLAGIAFLDHRPATDVVVFLDADGSDDPAIIPALIGPLARDEADLMLASRTLSPPEPGALSPAQRFGNWLACRLIRLFWRARFTDLAPCRALRLGTLRSLVMTDRDFGWTVQMQVRAARDRLRIREVPSRYRRRRSGRSKISGTVLGSVRAGLTILTVLAREVLRRGSSGAKAPGETGGSGGNA